MRLPSYCATLAAVSGRELGEISDEAKGVLLALAVPEEGEAALAGLAGANREECLNAWRGLGRLGQAARNAQLTAWREKATNGLPDGLVRLHPSWIEDALAGEPLGLLRYFLDRLPEALRPSIEKLMRTAEGDSQVASIDPALGRQVERIAFASLAPLCESAGGPLATRLGGLSFEELQAEVTRQGARTLGRSLAGADAGMRARVMALAGEPWASVMAEAFQEETSASQRRAAMLHAAGNVRASAYSRADRLLRIGLAVLKAELAAEGRESILRVAGRLPAKLGRRLLQE